jgi:2-polyprenyl-3-methyl-5-hydroxy-6-metoxy-1,4-benzoquinol methylase
MPMSFFPRDVAAPAATRGPVVEWEEPNCLLCGGPNWAPLLEAPDTTQGGTGLWFAVVQCHDCGLCFTNPRPTPAAIAQFYPTVYRPHHLQPERRNGWWHRLTRCFHRPRKERKLIARFGRGRLLDFGCGSGAFLERMRRQGWDVTGLDISAPTIDRVRGDLGLNALCGSLPHPDLSPESFELITMWHSLEHVHAPLEVLREAHRLLVPGGKLLVEVPNIDSLPFRCFGHVWYGLDLPRHLTHFAPWTLYLLLHKAGFRVGPIRMIRHAGWLRRSARLACATPQATWWHRCLKLRPMAHLATWYNCWTNQSDAVIVMAER